ncbi:MAG: dienelactone hydrolase family protein [Microthrixaceae bacterium]
MHISLPSGTSAYLAQPESASNALVIIPDILGLRPLFTDLCDSLSAQTGWAVCCFEPFPGKALPGADDPEFFKARSEALFQRVDNQLLGDAVAAADATGCSKVGLTGFCMGAMYALKASSLDRFSGVVAFYGMVHVPEAWAGPGQGDPLIEVQAARPGQVMAVLGSQDAYTPDQDVQELLQAGVRVERYEGADHGFVHDPSRPTHRAEDAADAWKKALEFLSP